MRRDSARIAQLRAHLRRRRHDVQAQQLFAKLEGPPKPVSTLTLALRHIYGDRHLRKLRQSLSRTLYRSSAP